MDLKNVVYSVTHNKCPHCLKGSFFISPNPYNLRKLGDMNNSCAKCGMDFRQEPGFYLGAAIMSYVLQVGVILLTYFIFRLGVNLSVNYCILIVAVVLLLLAPLTFQTSRLLWLNMLGTRPK